MGSEWPMENRILNRIYPLNSKPNIIKLIINNLQDYLILTIYWTIYTSVVITSLCGEVKHRLANDSTIWGAWERNNAKNDWYGLWIVNWCI